MRHIFERPRFKTLTLLVGAALVLTSVPMTAASASPQSGGGQGRDDIRITTVSTAPDMASGGDVLVRVEASRGDLTVALNGRDVTKAFQSADQGSLVGLVTGLKAGENRLTAKSRGQREVRLTVRNHPITGPIFSGRQQEPFVCKTEQWGFGAPLDDDCSAATTVQYQYRTSAGTFAALPDPQARPADLVQTTTSTGAVVPYIVRLERGTINRSVYEIAVLDDPRTPGPTPSVTEAGWNRRLVYTYGGGCRSGYHQGLGTGGVMSDLQLSRGYAVASSTLNVNDNNCNDVVSAETTMMVKERFIEQIGVPVHTIGWGGSGGAMQQYEIAQNYPGLLQGIIPTLSFPDASTYFIGADDCRVLLRPYLNDPANGFTKEQKVAVSGYAVWETCDVSHANRPGRLDPDDCDAQIPMELRYHPVNKPGGARCSIYDGMVNIFGRDSATGFARRPHDNVGVQYGLEALNRGVITKQQFLDLNQEIGGYDIDMNRIPQRTVADLDAIRTAYGTGRTTSGAGGLATVPIIDARSYEDLAANFHDSVRSFSMRERLVNANGHADNQVILRADPAAYAALPGQFLAQMDTWLTALGNDRSNAKQIDKVRRAKPADLVDACWTADGTKISEKAVYTGGGRCNELFPPHSGPRIAAGGPLSDDVWKCSLKPIEWSDYTVDFSPSERGRLQGTFPTGVCDYDKRSVGIEELRGTWLSFDR